MVVLAADRQSPRTLGDVKRQAAAAAVLIYNGAIVMRTATGFLTKGQAGLGLFGVGVATEQVDNSGGAAGAKSVEFREGIFRFVNSVSADAITIADIGRVCFVVDDQTVARTDGRTAGLPTRSPAGIVMDVDSLGVHVLFDEGRCRDALARRRLFVPLRVNTLVGSGVSRVRSPARGTIVQISSITEGVLTSGDATLTARIGATAITGGVITITQAGSAAGDQDFCNPTAANAVVEGDEISLTVGGTNATATVANCLIEIERP
jgi:hypothetical protein